jgi:hypothetical protein
MLKGVSLCAIAVLACGTAFTQPAFFYTSTHGSNAYHAHNMDGMLDLQAGYYTGVNYNYYTSDLSGGVFRTYSARVGRWQPESLWRVFGSVTPEAAGYRQTSFGGEFSHRLLGEQNIPPRKARLDARTRYVRRIHREQSFTSPGEDVHIYENDLTGGLNLRIKRTLLSASYTHTVYDRDFSVLSVPPGRVLDVAGVSAMLEGYPSHSYTLEGSQRLGRYLQIYTSYARIQFKTGDRSASSYTAGTAVYWKILKASFDYNLYKPSDASDRRYLSVGAGVQF